MNIPGITDLFILPASHLPSFVREQYEIGEMPFIALDIEPIEKGPGATAYFDWEQAQEGIGIKSELTFSAKTVQFSLYQDLAFIIVAADDNVYLMGAKEPPFPKLKFSKSLSTPSEGKAGCRYTFSWAGPLIPINFVFPSFPLDED